jgi:hypothetical protein
MGNNYYKYKVKWCPVCDQGWVQIFKEKNTQKLVLLCDECFSEWSTPDTILSSNTISTSNYDLIVDPLDKEIIELSWSKYIF